MKNKISLITLIACAAAGTTFAADPVEAFRASSGTTTNSTDATYVGNPVWASDAQQIGEKYVADLLSKYAPEDSFEWDSELNAFCQDETGYRDDDPTHHGGSYRQINAVFALTGTAQFTNAADATMSFRCESETAEHYSGYDPERKEYFTVNCDNLILFADSSKFTNEGTISYESYFTGTAGGTYEDWNSGKPIDFSVFLRDDAVFENAGTISAEPNNYVEYVSYNLFGNAKFVNAEGGEIKGMDLCLYGDSVVENAGLLDNSGLGDKPYVTLQENAKFVNTGTVVGETGYNFEFARKMTGTSKIENRGKMTNMSDVTFMYWLHGDETLSGVSATFENRGEISAADEYGARDIRFEADFDNESDVDFIAVGKANLAASDLNVKNYGKIDLGGTGAVVVVGTGVKLTLAEGSSIVGGNVSIGVGGTPNDSGVIPIADKDVLAIELTGKGGSEALISGDLDLCNSIELDVSFAEDAVQLKKYELKIWDGELRFKEYYSESDYGSAEKTPDAGFISLSGTLDAFDTTYIWSLDTETGVLTAKDVNFSEIVVADPVEAFRASSGTTTNSTDATYVGNPVWASDAQQIGEKYVADLLLAYGSPTFTWDSELNAFCQDETGYSDDDPTHHGGIYWQINAVFALTGTAQFTNAADAAMSFRCESETAEHYSGYDPERKEYFNVNCDNLILFADSSKFTNEGTISYESYFTDTAGGTYEDWNSGKPIGFSVFLRDDAVFENAGTISAEPDNYVECVSYNLFGNAKFVNTASGKIRGIDLWLSGDSVFENAGTIVNRGVSSTDDIYITLRENAKLVNTGAIDSDKYNFQFAREMTGTSKIENRGTMTNMSDVTFMYWLHGDETLSGVSATFENRGEISAADGYGVHDIRFEAGFENKSDDVDFIAVGKANLAASDLNVKNYGKIDLRDTGSVVVVGTGVKLTLAEGSSIVGGNVSIGVGGTPNDSGVIPIADKDVLVIELTGKGGSEALISGDLDLCNRIELDVSFAEDAVQLKKYELKIWDGELRFKEYYSESDYGSAEKTPDAGFIEDSLTGTLENFGTTYTWSLDTATGVLTAKDVNIGEEIDLTSPTQNVELGEKDVATLDPSLTEYSGNVSGAGQVSSSGDVEFSGDASALTGTLSVDAGTFTIAESAKLGEKATLDVAGTLALEGDRTLPNTLSGAGTLETAGVVALSGDASAFSGTTAIRSGTFTVAESAELGTGAFDVAGALALEGDRALSNTLSGAGQVSSSGDVEFSGDASALTGTLSVDAGTFTIAESAKLGEKATLDVAGTLALEGDRTLSNTLSGAGTLETAGVVALSGDASAFSGTTAIRSGTLTVAESAELGTGAFDVAGALALEGDRALSNTLSGAGQVSSSGDVEFSGDASELTGTLSVDAGTFTVAEGAKLGEKATLDVAGTLALEGDRTIANATSGDGAIELAAGATVKFAEEVGVKTLNVSDGATLSGGVSLTHKEAVLNLTGTLALDANADEKVTLGGGKVVLDSAAKLDLGGNAAGASFMAAGDAAPLENGGSVVIFENGTVEGDVVAFLRTDQTLAALAAESAVIYDATNGLSVQSLKNPSALTSYVDTSDLSSSFVGWALGGLEKELANLPHDFVSKDDLGGLDSNDPLLNALLKGDAGTARSILDRLSPKSYAAMIAMPVETFHDDVRSIAARLEQRRHDAAAGVDGDWQFFAQAQMISVENDTASDAPTFDFDRYGALAGADVKLDETTLLGVAVGAGTGDADIHNGGGKIESTDFRALAYFGKTFAERFYVNAGAQLGFASYDVKRRSDYGDANADVDGWNAGAFAEAGAAFAISETHGLYATPYVGLAYAHAETDSFTESGIDRAAFDADALEGDSLRARIGCAFSWDFALASTVVRLGLDVAYSRELLDDEIDVDVTASNGSRISETAAALPEDVFSIGPTLDVALTASASVYAGYAFQAGTDSSTAHSANVGFRMRF